jgi:AAA domain
MLQDPWRVRRSSKDPLTDEQRKDKHFQNLDKAKQGALVGLWATLPSFAVVGPPGVGKTYLLTEVLRRRFEAKPLSRILVTAQGHDALDHLQSEVKDVLTKVSSSELIIVRSTSKERPKTQEDMHRKASALLNTLLQSRLFDAAPPPLQDRMREVARSADRDKGASQPWTKEQRMAINAASSLVLDAADLVISTANSGDVGRLVEAREQFDWVIVEEAAKATGPELVGALMLSGRRLMIGDHHQLPPFEADRITRLLADHSLVVDVIKTAEQSIGPLLREGELADLSVVAQDETALRDTAQLALRLLEPFRTIVIEDERRAAGDSAHRPISATLSEQRRMDPAIARVVSNVFYGGKLRTEKSRIKEARREQLPFDVLGALPTSPIVVVDFKHVSRTGREQPVEREQPRFHNPGEVRAVEQVLRLVRARPDAKKPPSLAVLSFYKGQVEKLNDCIEAGIRNRSLAHLEAFRRAGRQTFAGTVDSFQGSEAVFRRTNQRRRLLTTLWKKFSKTKSIKLRLPTPSIMWLIWSQTGKCRFVTKLGRPQQSNASA